MLIKSSDDRTRDIDTLIALLSDPAASPRVRQDIDLQIRKIRAGARGEAEAAYEIDFDHKASANWAVLHDLRLEYQGRVAQIDHLMINRCLDIWVCESKHFQQGVAINEHGEFTAFHNNRATGIPSPLEQNRKHLEVLRAVLGSSLVQLPTRLGMAIRPTLHSVVLVSKNARITRPDKPVPGIEAVVKSDRLRDLINRRVDGNSAIGTLVSVAKMVTPETLESFARQLGTLHRSGSFDWAAKFGIARTAQRMPAAASPVATSVGHASAASQPSAAAPMPVRAAAPTDAPSAEADGGSFGAPDPRAAPAGPVRSSPETPVRPSSHPSVRPAAVAAPPVSTGAPDAGAPTVRGQVSADARTDPPAPPHATGPASAGEGPGPGDDGIARLSTSKLGARLGARNAAEMLDRLVRAGYLAPDGAGHVLTEKGRACGALFVEKSRFGPYFLWPSDLQP